MIKNFVSISGISDSGQLEAIRDICDGESLNFPIVIGYQVSSRSINEGTRNPRQPLFSELKDLNTETKNYGFSTAIHYYAKEGNPILNDLEKIASVGKPLLLQFNTLPPPVEVLSRAKELGYEVIFKVAVSDKQSADGGYKVWKGEGVQDVETGDANQLINQVFGEDIHISNSGGSYYLQEKSKNLPEWAFFTLMGAGLIKSKNFLEIHPSFKEVSLNNSEYLDIARDFAERYEELLGKQITLNVNYFK